MASIVLRAQAHPFDVEAFLLAHPHLKTERVWHFGDAALSRRGRTAGTSGFSLCLADEESDVDALNKATAAVGPLIPVLRTLKEQGVSLQVDIGLFIDVTAFSRSVSVEGGLLRLLAEAGVELGVSSYLVRPEESPSRAVSLSEAAEQVATWREQGHTIALANGVFDLLHVGHLRYLEGAKALASRLVVAVNSDASTRAYKGPGRPVIPEAERAELLVGLSCTDLVLVFDEPDVRAVIRTLKPDVHVKGTDYTEQSIPERAEVEAYGGRVAIAGDPKDHSTTEIRTRMGN